MVRNLVLTAVMTIASVTCGNAQAPAWTVDSKGCKIWNSTPKSSETASWSGACVGGFADGKGMLFWSLKGEPEEFFLGDLKRGHYDGYGLQVWPSGDRYEGNYRSDQAHGQGTYRTQDGGIISGQWVNGCLRANGRVWTVGANASECR